MHIPPAYKSLLKQLVGGLTGSAVAFAIYTGYGFVKDPIHAFLASAFAQETRYTAADREAKWQQIASDAQAILQEQEQAQQ